ncbi:YbhN family protein [Actinoplanes sp. NPDC048988]|uniref:lysylphosphatidylglycerol synthase transmembrane domain-containing protein n=1 Tax=Actinoplanes sp. NPDC048988 TaxID=3363901 RepID=UPI00371DD560
MRPPRPAAFRLAPAALRLAPVVFPFAPAALLFAPAAFRPAASRPISTRPEPPAPPPPRPWRPALRVLLGAAAAAAVVIALRGRIPDPSSVATTLTHAEPRWLAVAVAAQFLSQAGFALQQRTLLAALGTDLRLPDALAITFSRTAMGSVLPAGSAMSAAFALQQFRRRGALATAATAAVVLSAAASMLGLAVLYGATAAVNLKPAHTAELAAAVLAVAAVVAWIARSRRAGSLRAPSRRPESPVSVLGAPFAPPPAAGSPTSSGPTTRPTTAPPTRPTTAPPTRPTTASTTGATFAAVRRRWLERAIAQAHRMLGEARALRPRYWLTAVGFATLNWALDLACLIAVAQACGFPLSPLQLTSVYLAVQIVRQIPITPGGIGLIEASLLAGFLAAGAPQAAAAAVVLGYRVISFWLMLPIGLGTYLRLSRSRPGLSSPQHE